MKKKLRKFLGRLMALIILASCFGVTVSAGNTYGTSFDAGAGDDTSLTINTDRTNRTFDIYQIFYGDYTKTAEKAHVLSDVQWGVSIVNDEYDFSSDIIKWLTSEYLPSKSLNPLYEDFKEFIGKSGVTAEEISQKLATGEGVSQSMSQARAEAFSEICGYVIDQNGINSNELIFETDGSGWWTTLTAEEQEELLKSYTIDQILAMETGTAGSGKYEIEKRTLTSADYSDGTGYVIEGIHDGYYLVCDVTDALTADVKSQMRSRYILQVAGPSIANIKLPSEPTIEKKILLEDGTLADYTQAAVGDEITYQITGKVPDMSDFNEFYYIVEDEMYYGLTFTGIKSVSVGDIGLTETSVEDDSGTTYTVEYTAYYDGNMEGDGSYEDDTAEENKCSNLRITFSNMKQYKKGDTVTILYTATLNEDCSIGSESVNYNKAMLTYSNDPKHIYEGKNRPSSDSEKYNYMGSTPTSTVYAYTTGIRIEKVDQDGQPLTGAQFKIESEALNQLIEVKQEFIAQGYGKAEDSGKTAYYKLSDGTYTDKYPEGSKEYESASGTADVSENTVQPVREFVKYKRSYISGYGLGFVRDMDHGTYYYDFSNNAYVDEETTKPQEGIHETDVVYYYMEPVTTVLTKPEETEEYYREVGEDGILELNGLKAGTYTITEVKQPEGYNKLDNPITVKIDWEEPKQLAVQDGCTWDYEVDMDGGTDFSDYQSDMDGEFSLKVVNSIGTTLPQTGGIGTVLCYVIGSILVITSATLLTIRFRRAYREKKSGT